MDEHSELRKMIEEGRDQLEWYRTVDPAKLRTVQAMIQAPNYKENMAQIVKTILEFAFLTYSGGSERMFQILIMTFRPSKRTYQGQLHEETGGQSKKYNSGVRKPFPPKTLLEILPPDLLEPVQQRLHEDKMSPDLVSIHQSQRCSSSPPVSTSPKDAPPPPGHCALPGLLLLPAAGSRCLILASASHPSSPGGGNRVFLL